MSVTFCAYLFATSHRFQHLDGWDYLLTPPSESQVNTKMTQTTVQAEKQLQEEKAKLAPLLKSKWSNRFVLAAIIQGLAATLVTVPIFLPTVTPSVAMVIAGGSAGTWFTMGYVMYIMVGVIAVGVTALFYHHFEVDMNKPYTGVANGLAWVHLILMNVGVAAVAAILMYGGYYGGAAMLPVAEGGLGWTAGQVHVNILGALVNPAGYALITTAIGVLAGGLGFVLTYFKK